MKNEIMQRITEVFREVLGDENLEIRRDSAAGDVEEWDSLSHINIVLAVEAEFGVKFALGELEELMNVGNMADMVEGKIGDK
jgi:acyl carrier protein